MSTLFKNLFSKNKLHTKGKTYEKTIANITKNIIENPHSTSNTMNTQNERLYSLEESAEGITESTQETSIHSISLQENLLQENTDSLQVIFNNETRKDSAYKQDFLSLQNENVKEHEISQEICLESQELQDDYKQDSYTQENQSYAIQKETNEYASNTESITNFIDSYTIDSINETKELNNVESHLQETDSASLQNDNNLQENQTHLQENENIVNDTLLSNSKSLQELESHLPEQDFHIQVIHSTYNQSLTHTSEIDSLTSDTENTQATLSNETSNSAYKQDYVSLQHKNAKSHTDSLHSHQSKKPSKIAKSFSQTKKFFLQKLNLTTEFLESLFVKEPLVYSLAYENNIACKLNETMLVLKDGNLCCGIKIEGVSYAGATMNKEIELAKSRNQFWNRLTDDIELNIFCKKELMDLNLLDEKVKNLYAERIIKKWESGTKAYKITYTLIFSTKKKRITGYFESKKRKMTQEQEENKENLSFEHKEAKLKEILQLAMQDFSDFTPHIFKSDEILNFYATYCNMQNTNLSYSNNLLTDSYITSDIEFKKDYMIFYTNLSEKHVQKNINEEMQRENRKDISKDDYRKKVYARFISIKAYEGESLSTIIPTSILRESSDYYCMIHCEAINREQAIKKVKRVKTFAVDLIKNQLEELTQLLQSERENILKISFSVLIVSYKNIQDLNEKTDSMKSLLEKQNLSIVKETLNQKPLFFSFFPSRGNLNARMRYQSGAALSTLCIFENDILGNNANRWGKRPITTFQHLSGSPFLFNFHDNDTSSAVGHTLVIGGTGFGKTTLMQFLMLNLLKYDINIFAMDKLRGMHNFTEYIGGEYHDLGYEKFKLNPFSLEDTSENNEFLKQWLEDVMNITQGKEASEAEIEGSKMIQSTIQSLRASYKDLDKQITLTDFYQSIPLANEKINLKGRIEPYLKSLFDNSEDALNFNKQLSILNMDSILNNQNLAGLSAMYLFHKIKNISKNADKGFFIWIDELRDYLGVESMRTKIIEAIVEIRKINGVIAMGIQNLDFLENVANANTFIDNMSNFVILSTNDETTLEKLRERIGLSESEINFLKTTKKSARQILFKQKEVGSSILDINLRKLGNYLRIFSSSASDVKQLNDLKMQYPKEWREMYLQDRKPKENTPIQCFQEQEAIKTELKQERIQKERLERVEKELQEQRKQEGEEREKNHKKRVMLQESIYENMETETLPEVLAHDAIETSTLGDIFRQEGEAQEIPYNTHASNDVLLQEIHNLKAQISQLQHVQSTQATMHSSTSYAMQSHLQDSQIQQVENETQATLDLENVDSKESEYIQSSSTIFFHEAREKDMESELDLKNLHIQNSEVREKDFLTHNEIQIAQQLHDTRAIDCEHIDIESLQKAQEIQSSEISIQNYNADGRIESSIDNIDIKDSELRNESVWNLDTFNDETDMQAQDTFTHNEESSNADVWEESDREFQEDMQGSGDSSGDFDTSNATLNNQECEDTQKEQSHEINQDNIQDSNNKVIDNREITESTPQDSHYEANTLDTNLGETQRDNTQETLENIDTQSHRVGEKRYE
ncbi:hypothetical protein CQA53_05650 [Helicobacter didelphidarum]|uniref:CagE TrbE VirB component of type IV transporter system central domain-containing protein n=1 Tax=Helicobacter didelphidarum TaxID=2040648 RepID=A0A3D8IKA1_9HELI|nr:hypothetical protein [Helicobacter didelphidarum]RDU65777.1 hypothetical protein CQA53_05650 [Helicobacter didelphidarum]